MEDDDHPPASKADQYRHTDGTTEVVYALEGGEVLTIREYQSVDAFERRVADAEYLGEHPGVADLPGVGQMDDDSRSEE